MITWVKMGLFAVCLAAIGALVTSPALSYPAAHYGWTVAAAALAAYLLLLNQRRKEQGAVRRADAPGLALAVLLSALVGARLAYCLSRFSFYFIEMGMLSVLRIWEGGFMLYGAVLGAMLASALLAKRCGASVPAALDEIAAPGLLAVAICRLGEWGTGEGVGAWVESEWMMRFPFAVMNDFEEWQLAVFLLEAIAALAVLFIVLRMKAGGGRRILTALLLYACCQIVLESLRMDSCLKIGFVRISQVISGLVVLGVTCLRAYRAGGRNMAVVRGAVVAALIGVIGGVEWALDKTPVSNLLLYAVMIAVCALLMANGSRFAAAQQK